MRAFNKFMILLFVTLLGFTAVKGVSAQAASDKVRLGERSVSIEKGTSYKLSVLSTKEEIRWESSNKKIAKVSSKGRVFAKKAGSCKIYAYVGTRKLTCRVTVYNNYSVTNEKYHISGFSTLMGKLPLKKFKYDDTMTQFKELSTLGKSCVVYFGLDAKGSGIVLDSDNYVYFIKNIIKTASNHPDNSFLTSLAETAGSVSDENALFEDENGNEYYAVMFRESDFDNVTGGTNDADKNDEGFCFVYYPNKKGTDYDCIMIGCDEGSFERIGWYKE